VNCPTSLHGYLINRKFLKLHGISTTSPDVSAQERHIGFTSDTYELGIQRASFHVCAIQFVAVFVGGHDVEVIFCNQASFVVYT
jgi:hypothetical protein